MIRWLTPLIAAVIAGCAQIPDRVVLLEGAVVVRTAKGETELNAPYAAAEVARGKATPGSSSADEVRSRYGALLDAQPPRPRSFEVFFIFNKAELTAASTILLGWIKTAIAGMPGVDIVVIGHTDRVGPQRVNDRLSVRRAEVVRDALVAIGVPVEKIAVVGRGEREPAVATADEVPEPRNRRAEIKVR